MFLSHFWKQWANLVMIKRTSMVSSLKLQDDSDSKLYFILACLPHMKASKAWSEAYVEASSLGLWNVSLKHTPGLCNTIKPSEFRSYKTKGS